MDIFDKLIQANLQRKEDSPDEKRILETLRTLPSHTGTLEDLTKRLTDVEVGALLFAVSSLASRGRIQVLPGNRFRWVEGKSPA